MLKLNFTDKMRLGFALTLALLAAIATCRLYVQSPQELVEEIGNEGVIAASYANFGHIPYGSSISGEVYFDEKNDKGCDKYSYRAHSWQGIDAGHISKIFIQRRGDCPFVQKVRNAELAGAKMVVIVDS